jgi:hypothetical protein
VTRVVSCDALGGWVRKVVHTATNRTHRSRRSPMARHPHARIEDAERQAVLQAHGEHVLRITWHQATAHADRTVTRVYNAGPRTGARAASSASPIASTTSSVPAGPTSSMPTGSPSPVRPAGTDSAGSPAPLAGSVLRT